MASNSVFLTLTPAKLNPLQNNMGRDQLDNVSLQLDVKPVPNDLVLDNKNQTTTTVIPIPQESPTTNGEHVHKTEPINGELVQKAEPLSNGLTVVPIHQEGNTTKGDESKVTKAAMAVPTNSMLAESITEPTSKTQQVGSVLPRSMNSKQDTVATTTVNGEEAPLVRDEVLYPATRLKRQLENTKDLIVCPGVYDGFSARIALATGFDALYMVSSFLLAPEVQLTDIL